MIDNCNLSLDMLVFSVCGVHFAVDAGQVSEISAYTGEQADDLFWFHNEFGYGETAQAYFSPTVIAIRTADGRSYRVIIDLMEDIAEFGQNDIRLLPELLEPFAIRKGLWGVIPRNEIMVLLVDFKLFLKQKHAQII